LLDVFVERTRYMTLSLSVVTTLFNSAKTVKEFCERTISVCERSFGRDFEIILVDDGSSDESVEIARRIALMDSRIKLIVLSRNFGHHSAIHCGLVQATGNLVFLIDSDLEEKPEWLEDFLLRFNSGGSDVVYGVQDTRKGKLVERVTGEAFWRILRFVSGVPMPKNQSTVRLMSRRYLDALLSFGERSYFFAGVAFETGFDQEALKIHKASSPNSTYTLKRKLSLASRAIVGYSQKPLTAVAIMGGLIAGLSFVIGTYYLVSYIFYGSPLPGWTSLMVSVWFLGGVLLLSLGVIGLYLNQVLLESKKRPRYIVKSSFQLNSEN